MQLISLNAWGGKMFAPLCEFVAREQNETDIFFFQEVWSNETAETDARGHRKNIFEEISSLLPEHAALFFPIYDHPLSEKLSGKARSGLGIFIRKNIEVRESGYRELAKELYEIAKQDVATEVAIGHGYAYAVVECAERALLVIGVHGVSRPGNKHDTPLRLAQSQAIREFIRARRLPAILAGDFNLELKTKSVALLADGMQHLVEQFGITDTRGDISRSKFPEGDWQYYADYAFATPDIKVNAFSVPHISISDHLPLIMNFTLQ